MKNQLYICIPLKVRERKLRIFHCFLIVRIQLINVHLWITRMESLKWVKASHVFQQSQKIRTERKCYLNSNKIWVWKERVILCRTSQLPYCPQVAEIIVNTDFKYKLSMNLLNTIIKESKFHFSGWWFNAAGVDNFLQYCVFCFKGRHLDLGIRNNSLKSINYKNMYICTCYNTHTRTRTCFKS